MTSSSFGDDSLREFVDVTTRKHVDEALGFSIEYPYEWNPSLNPLTESDFYVGASYALPSFWLNVETKPDNVPLDASLSVLDLSRFTNHEEIDSQITQLNGHVALLAVVRWVTPDAGRHFVETQIICTYIDDRWFILTINQSDRDTPWRPRLQKMLQSFTVLDKDS